MTALQLQDKVELMREQPHAMQNKSGGLARLALFACKKRDSPKRTQAGAVDRAWRDLRDRALGILEDEGR